MNRSNTATHEEKIQKIAELIKEVRIAMLTTVAADGSLRSRPMGTQDAPFNGEVWFFTSDESGKISEIAHNRKVGLSYSRPDKQTYVSLSGVGTVVHDRAKAEELWTPLLKAWFPLGLNDPHLALLRVDVHSAEYWDAPSSTMVNLFHMAKAALSGGGPQEEWGEHGTAKLR